MGDVAGGWEDGGGVRKGSADLVVVGGYWIVCGYRVKILKWYADRTSEHNLFWSLCTVDKTDGQRRASINLVHWHVASGRSRKVLLSSHGRWGISRCSVLGRFAAEVLDRLLALLLRCCGCV